MTGSASKLVCLFVLAGINQVPAIGRGRALYLAMTAGQSCVFGLFWMILTFLALLYPFHYNHVSI